jgi:Na+/proline symporter
VWNDCIQFAVYMLGAIVAAVLLLTQLPGGWDQLVAFGQSTGRWQMFDFDPNLTKSSMTFWAGCIGGAFLSLATHGADQLIVQRYLCAGSRAAASWALGLSGLVVFAQFALFLFIGVELAAFNAQTGGIGNGVAGDEAFMTYVVNHMGVGVKGLIFAAILSAAMSTIASSLNSSASSLVGDWLGPVLPELDDRKSLLLSRLLTLFFAGVQCAVAIVAYQMTMQEAVVDQVLKIAGFAIGLLLGLYGLGLLASRTSQGAALAAFAVGTVVTTWVAFATPINGYWYTLVGSGTIVIAGLVFTMILDWTGGNASRNS